jgi:hypothetical protein
MPGYSKANSRLMGIYYGHTGQMMWEWRSSCAARCAGALIVIVAGIAAATSARRLARRRSRKEP